ncbi:uncharacterized protein K02A2.6-like [Aedes albopictus]|uniref:RNA-directed DNA polymerase n=1 Tax=Aedes albopictus TaxID=7160 RepID=A0ABM1ZER5_AEDAL
MGHKEGYCGCFTKPSSPTAGDNSNQKKGKKHQKKTKYQANIVHTVSHTGALTRFVTTTLNGRQATLQLDSGSPITIISEETWRKVGSPSLKPSTCEALSASRDPLPLLGEFTCLVGVNDVIKPGLCRVTSVKGLHLFGSEWMDLFDMWTKPLSSFVNQVNQSNSNSFSGKHFLMRFPEVFQDTLGHCQKAQVSLHLKPDARPVFRPKRPVPYNAIPLVDAELERLQQLGIISPVEYSDWAAPIVAVRKPGGKIRICADYSTGLNAMLEAHNFPLPTPDDIFSKLAGSKVFSIIDLSDAYLQVEVDEASKRLLTINTHRGLFHFNRLAPGVKSAPGAFQQLMHTMIAGIEGVEVFLDDFILFSKTKEQHYETLCTLFNRLQEYGFRLKLEKCHFYQDEIKYLGHIVDENGLRPDPEKTAAISSMPRPTDVSTLRSFLGAVNFYGKFIREMHQLRRPLDQLLKKDAKFVWSAECQQAFTDIKRILQSDLLLTHYDPSLEIIVAGDASKTGIGAVIMHRFPDGRIKAIAHASKTLSSAEQNYGQIEKEALALVFAVTKFHRMLLGRRFKLQTDHQPLVKVFESKKGIPIHTANRLKRWALTLLGYDFDIEFVSTNNFGYADVLSRLISNHERPEEEFVVASLNVEPDLQCVLDSNLEQLPITFQMVKQATSEDPSMQQLVRFIKTGWPKSGKSIHDSALQSFFHRRESLSVVQGCVMMMERLVIPECFRKKLLKQLHRGHPGIERVKAIARGSIYWPNFDDDIGEYVRNCSSCANAQKSPPQAEPHPWQSAEGPWERIHVDYAGPTNGFSYLVVVDSFSKWPEIFLTKSTTASTTIGFLQEAFARFGIPKVIVSDNGTQFTGYEFRSFCENLGIIHLRTAPFHPQSNGQAERFVDTLKRSLRKIQEGEGLPASAALQTFLQVYRATPSNLLEGKSPSEILNGRRMRTTLDLLKPSVSTPHPPAAAGPSRTRRFSAGATVLVKVHRNNTSWKWQSGVVIEAIGNVHYNVLLDAPSGRKRLIRSHIDQIRSNDSGKQEEAEIELPLFVLLNDFGITPNAMPPVEPLAPLMVAEDSSFLSAQELPDLPDERNESVSRPGPSSSSTPLVPRPTRTIRLPRHLQDFVLS